MKSGLRKLLSTFSDVGSVRDEPPSPRESETSRASRAFSFGETRSKKMNKKKSQEEIIRLLTDLGDERKRTLELHERLQSLLSANTEVRAAAAVQVDEERRMRVMAEKSMRDSRSRLLRAERELKQAQCDKDYLEAELMEAASDVMAQHAMHEGYQQKLEGEKAAWLLLQQADEDRNQLEKRLKASEAQRMSLLKSMAALRNHSPQWEKVFDLLQVERPIPQQKATLKVSARPQLLSGSNLPPIIEYEGEGEASETSKGSAGDTKRGARASNMQEITAAEDESSSEISFHLHRPSSPLSMFGSEISVSSKPLSYSSATYPQPITEEITVDESDSDDSHESLVLPHSSRSGTLGEYITANNF